jgi:hypothetical protein
MGTRSAAWATRAEASGVSRRLRIGHSQSLLILVNERR